MTTPDIIRMMPSHAFIVHWHTIPKKYIQNGYDLHLFTEYKLNKPRNWSRYPNMLRIGTTIVSGREKDERMDVMVEIQIELQAPPEQIVRGIESEEKILRSTSLNSELVLDFSGSIKLKAEYTNPARMRRLKHFLCLTIHLSSSISPCIPPSSFIAFCKVNTKIVRIIPVIINLARLRPRCTLRQWYPITPITNREGVSVYTKGKVSSSLMQAQIKSRVTMCAAIDVGQIGSSIFDAQGVAYILQISQNEMHK